MPNKLILFSLLSSGIGLLFLLFLLVLVFIFLHKNPGDYYPSAMINGPAQGFTGDNLPYRIYARDPSSNNSTVTLYWGHVIYGGHQDSWNIVEQRPFTGGQTSFISALSFPTVGTYWVMVNVNSNSDRNRTACTGNPSYSPQELVKIHAPSCGLNSFAVVNIQNKDLYFLPE